jgi:tRNA(Ile)-lysidine synthetase-like protein
LPFVIEAAEVRSIASSLKRGIEDTAREIRYRFLLRAAREQRCAVVAVGHSMSDQAETLLMKLARGSGLRGLGAMRPVVPLDQHWGSLELQNPGVPQAATESDNSEISLVRPLLCLTRPEIEKYCRDRGLEFRTDRTNLSRDYARNRVRHDILPLLGSLNPQIIATLARTADILAADDEALETAARSALDSARLTSAVEGEKGGGKEKIRDESVAFRVEPFVHQPAAIRRRMLILAMTDARRANGLPEAHTEASQVAAAERLLEPGASGHRVDLSGGLELWREFDHLAFQVRIG